MSLREALRDTPADPAIRWLGYQIRHYRKPKMVRKNDVYDRQTVEILSRVPGNYLDIGAAGGSILEKMLQVSPNGRHVAFEPIPAMADRVRSRFPGVELHQVALSDTPGETTFYVAPNDPGRSGLRQQDGVEHFDEVTVQIETLDNLVHHRVDAIKLDVEGAELGVLRGGERLLREHHPVIVFEHGAAAKHFNTTPANVWDFLDSLGYEIRLLPSWLKGRKPLSKDRFTQEATTRNWYFVAS